MFRALSKNTNFLRNQKQIKNQAKLSFPPIPANTGGTILTSNKNPQ